MVLSTIITVGILSALVGWIVSTTTTGIAIKCASDQIEKGTSNLGASLNFTISKLPSLLIAQLVTGILTTIARANRTVSLVYTGTIIAIMFSLIVPAIIVEQKGAFESLGRSRRLVSNRWLRTFVLLLILGIIVVVVTVVVNLLATPLNFIYPNSNLIITSIASSFVAPISAIAMTYLYYAMVAREIPPPPPPPF